MAMFKEEKDKNKQNTEGKYRFPMVGLRYIISMVGIPTLLSYNNGNSLTYLHETT